ncbi:MAG: hypothetical protein GQ564_05785 [Bacteroidales bacterium]|nr:hypothetical protein [Bacteroidales bacterium]
MAKVKENTELTVEEKLKALYELQMVDSKIDNIKRLRGELPLEVQDLEDEIEGLQTRVQNYEDEAVKLGESINNKKNEIKDSQALIKKYTEQQNNVRNNREYDSLSKEIEFQTLEIELCEKRIREYTIKIEDKKKVTEESKGILEDRTNDLETKNSELNSITSETQKEEEDLENKSLAIQEIIEDRLRNAYKKIRGNARNGLAVVSVQRDACGGCFNKIPPQRQLDVRSRKKIIVCEYCGRIFVDPDMEEEFK